MLIHIQHAINKCMFLSPLTSQAYKEHIWFKRGVCVAYNTLENLRRSQPTDGVHAALSQLRKSFGALTIGEARSKTPKSSWLTTNLGGLRSGLEKYA